MNKFDYNNTKGLRQFYGMADFVKAISNKSKVWSWGAHNYIKMNDYTLRFTVKGYLHKGHVYVVVNASDLFDVYLTSNQGNIQQVIKDIYVDDFIDMVDAQVEYIPEYGNR